MPPKWESTGSSRPAIKKTKARLPARAAKAKFEPPRGKRWSAVSGSANAEGQYRMVWKDEEKAYSYITLCSAPYLAASDEEDEEDEVEDEDEEDGEAVVDDDDDDDADDADDTDDGNADDDGGEKRLGPRCGKGKQCVCFLPLSSNPENPWVISWAGFRKFSNQFLQVGLRVPDYFDMYAFNDHAGYGSLEVLQNLILDFEEAAAEGRGGDGGWRERWAVCEAVAHWLLHHAGSGPDFTTIDDRDTVFETMNLIGRMFLSMLAQLDALGLVGDATVVKSLGCTMALYMVLSPRIQEYDPWESEEGDDPDEEDEFHPGDFDCAVLSYADKRGVTLRGPPDIDEIVAEAGIGDFDLPPSTAKDPWGYKAALEKYMEDRDGEIGGDRYDITAWSSAERKAAAFDRKDPLGKRERDALKKGLVLTMG